MINACENICKHLITNDIYYDRKEIKEQIEKNREYLQTI